MSEVCTHPFARTLGDGPYTLIGFGRVTPKGYSGPHIKSGAGTCAHCSTAILDVCVIENGLGERFGVGTTCVEKVDMPLAFISKFKAEKNKRDRERRRIKKLETAQRIKAQYLEQALTLTVEQQNKLLSLPHPRLEGLTLNDYLNFLVRVGSYSSALTVLKRVQS